MTGMRYAIVIEHAGRNYSAYSPDVPGVIGVGDTPEECRDDMRDGIAALLGELAKEGKPAPEPRTIVEHVDV